VRKSSSPKKKKITNKKILLNVHGELEERLRLTHEMIGGGTCRAGKMTALIRKALDDFLPSLSEIQDMMDKKVSSQEVEKMLVTKDATVIGESFAEVRNP